MSGFPWLIDPEVPYDGPLYVSLHTGEPTADNEVSEQRVKWTPPELGDELYQRILDRLEVYPSSMLTTKLVLHVPDDRYGAVLEAVGRALSRPSTGGSTSSERMLVELLDNTERLITMTEDLSTAQANLDAEVTQDLADKQALRDAVAALQAANGALQSTVTGDEAALADAKSQLANAAAKVQAATDKLSASDTDLPPASPPVDVTPPVEPAPEPAPPVEPAPEPVPAPVEAAPEPTPPVV